MTANHKPLFNKGISGSILLELNVMFMLFVLIGGVYCNTAQTVLRNRRTVLADIEIAKSARYIETILSRELSYNMTQAKLAKDFNGRDQIICQKTAKNVRTYWYLSNAILYRKTLKNTTTGINPYSGPDIRLTWFKTFPLAKRKIGIVMNLQDPKSGLERQIAFSMYLSNGAVVK